MPIRMTDGEAALQLQRVYRGHSTRAEQKRIKRHITAERYCGPQPKNYCVVQWETAAFYTYESEVGGMPVPDGDPVPDVTKMSIGMARLGSSKGRARCRWRTFDMSAQEGRHYIGVPATEVVFEEGETHKDLTVYVIPCASFDGTTELGLYIEQGSGKGCAIGKYLHTATIKIIDTSSFPTDALRPWVKGGDREKVLAIPPSTLVWNFLKVCWSLPAVRVGSKKVMLAHQFHSLYGIGLIFIMFFIVRTLGPEGAELSDGDKESRLTLLAAAWSLPLVLKHYLDYSKMFWKVGGSLRSHLQTLLLKKFLNYTDESRNDVNIEQLLMALIRDVSACVSEAYIAAIDLAFGAIMKIAWLIAAMISLQVYTGTFELSIKPLLPLIAVLCLPLPIGIFLAARQKKCFSLRAAQFAKENHCINHVITSVLNYPLVADYDRRTLQLSQYGDKLTEYNGATTQLNANATNSRYFVPWLVTLLVSGYIVVGGLQVVRDGGRSLAQFLTTIGIFRAFGGEFTAAYGLILRITSAYASIAQVTIFLNMPIDVPQRLTATRQRRRKGKQLRAELRKGLETGKVPPLSADDVPVDRMEIIMDGAAFSYKPEAAAAAASEVAITVDGSGSGSGSNNKKKRRSSISDTGLAGVRMKIDQGQMVSIVGPPSQGKATIMRLIAGQIFPSVKLDSTDPINGKCTLFLPPHLRVVQVTENPMIFNTSVFLNMAYGIKPSPGLDWPAIKKRALKIAKRLGMSVELTSEHFEASGYLGAGGVKITRADRQLISLGRALLMNPELIICHKPTALLDDRQTDNVLDMFKEYTENRGVFMPSNEPLVRRRRRTVIFSAKNEHVASHANVVYEARKGALRLIPTGETKTATLKALSRAFKGINRETLKMMQQSAGNSTDDEDEEEDEEEDDEDTTEQNGHKAQKFGSSYQVSNRTMNVLTLDAPDEDGLIEMGTASIDRSTPQRSGSSSGGGFGHGQISPANYSRQDSRRRLPKNLRRDHGVRKKPPSSGGSSFHSSFRESNRPKTPVRGWGARTSSKSSMKPSRV